MSEAKIPGDLLFAFNKGSKLVYVNKFQGSSGTYYRIHCKSAKFEDVKLFIFPNEIGDYLKAFKAIALDAANLDGLELPEPTTDNKKHFNEIALGKDRITETPVEEPEAPKEDKCDRCGGLSFEVFPGRGTQCVNCGKIYWVNNG